VSWDGLLEGFYLLLQGSLAVSGSASKLDLIASPTDVATTLFLNLIKLLFQFIVIRLCGECLYP